MRFAVVNGSESSYTSGGAPIYLYLDADGKTLIGSITPYASGLDASSTAVLEGKVFAAVLNSDSGLAEANDTYSFTLFQQVDGGVGSFSVSDSGYNFEGAIPPTCTSTTRPEVVAIRMC